MTRFNYVARHYRYRGNGGDFDYTSHYRLGSWANYDAFKSAYERRFGRYGAKPTWSTYKKWIYFSIIVREED